MTRDADNRYTVVWFDFRDAYKFDGRVETAERFETAPADIPASTWQRLFVNRFQGLLDEPIRHATDFPSFLLLDLLRNDLMIFEVLTSFHRRLLPVATHIPVISRSLDKRLESLEFTQSMIRKAEEMHRLIIHMKDPQSLDLIAKDSRSRYIQSLRQLEMGSSLLVSEFRRQDELADKRLDVYNQFAQQRQASSLAALTYCAAFFLPLSLAGTFLSMQSRATELHLLVYDFVGVTSVFGTLAMLIYFVSWSWSRVKVRWITSRLEQENISIYESEWFRSLRLFSILAWLLTVCSFLVGMLDNLRLGLTLLAAPVAVLVLSIPCTFFFVAVLGASRKFKRSRDDRAQRDAKDDMEARIQ